MDNYKCSYGLYLGVDELKRAKIDVNTSAFLQFLLHLPM
jgi:hypothetical protein